MISGCSSRYLSTRSTDDRPPILTLLPQLSAIIPVYYSSHCACIPAEVCRERRLPTSPLPNCRDLAQSVLVNSPSSDAAGSHDLGGGAATLAFVMGLAASAGPFGPSISSRTGSYAELSDALPSSPSRVAGIELRKSWKVEPTRGSTPAESRGPHVEMSKLAR